MSLQVFAERCSRTEREPQVVVILPPGDLSRRRFDAVIAPAVAALVAEGRSIVTARPEIARTFDSIERALIGIAQSQIVLADVSPVGQDSKTGAAYRDGEVMYLIGAAIACRHPRDVMLLRQEDDRLQYDGSVLPVTVIDFENIPAARQVVIEELRARLEEGEKARGA